MGYVIAVAGKGGTGKTTLSALLVRLLAEKCSGSVLAIDADPNSNLAEVLGIASGTTIGDILDTIALHPESIPVGMSKDRFIEYEVQRAVVETDGFDLLTMGRPEGPGCYCFVNNVLKNVMGKLIKDYEYILIDNEAGLEHLSRRTTRAADTLLIVSDATVVGLKAARRICALVKELKINTKKNVLVINRFDEEVSKEKVSIPDVHYAGQIPFDDELFRLSVEGASVFKLSDASIGLNALRKIGEKIWTLN